MLLRGTNTLYPLAQWRDDFNRLARVLGHLPPREQGGFGADGSFPGLNVWEAGDELFAEAELPGFNFDDVEVSVVGNELTLKGRRTPAEHENTTFHRRERSAGEFTRVVRLPVDIDANKVHGTLRDGVLLVTLPKAAVSKPRTIKVTGAKGAAGAKGVADASEVTGANGIK